ncbi:hypothetical protein SteCoe_2961 [Stentor coeruleus]|uniref:Uncharacterized protein n=1 Tax=Stentor coeruleus TaxID=5963 RepID=A0A1R2CY49_9CILI|nr:hypothetical protein SteCoe_2961 [Stentor coeruleus]
MGNNDSRTIFRDQIQNLVNEDIPSEKFEYWDMLFSTSVSFSDVYTMIPDADITTLLTVRKGNFLRLLDYSVSILEDIVSTQDLSSAKIIAGCTSCRILIRLLPYIAEDDNLMWNEDLKGIKLITTILRLMFVPNFAVLGKNYIEISDCGQVDGMRLWGQGFYKGDDEEVVNDGIWMVRYDLVKILLTLCSTDMYRKNNEPCRNLWALFIVSKANLYASQVFYSLINVVVGFNYMGSWKLPYGSYFNYEHQEKTVQISIQLLCILSYIRYEHYEDISILEKAGFLQEDFTHNYFLTKFREINTEQEIAILYNSIKTLISIVTISQNTYLPNSVKDIQCKDEIVIMLWALIKYSPKFKEFLGLQTNTYEMLIPLVQMLNSQDFLVVSCTTYVILHLSTNRDITSNLYHTFPNVTVDLPLFYGNYSDFLVIALSKIILADGVQYNKFLPYFFMILCNISPYMKTIAPFAAQSIIRLLEKVSLRTFLLENEKNHYLLFFVLETINNIIQYQWQGAAGLVLGLVRKKDILIKIFQLPERWEDNKEIKEPWKTREWYNKWTQILPIDVLRCLLNFIIQKLEVFLKTNPKMSEDQILEYISQETLVGILPPPARIQPRVLEITRNSDMYEHNYTWALIYIKSLPYAIVPKEKIQLVTFSG